MADLRAAIVDTSSRLGIDPVDLATVISYETAGTFDPWKKGPKTQWGRHRGLIQWGEPQRRKYGVYKDMPVADQVRAAGEYLKDAGVRPGMGILDVYSAINAGKVGRYNASDANNGGAPGTVRDKVENQMASHRRKAAALLGNTDTAATSVAESPPPVPMDGSIARSAFAGQEMASAGSPALQAINANFTPTAPPQPLQVTPVSRKKVLDPAVLEQLNQPSPITQGNVRKKVADPELLKLLNGAVDPATNQPPGVPEYVPPGVEGYDPKTGEVAPPNSAVEKTGAAIFGALDLPIVGPALQTATKAGAAAIAAPLSGQSFSQTYGEMSDIANRIQTENPNIKTAGQVAGTLATLIPLGMTGMGARALGVTGNSLMGRVGASAASNALISGADTAVRGGTLADVGTQAGIGGAIGGAIPAVGAAVNAIGRGIGNAIGPRVNALIRPGAEAERRVGVAMATDAKNAAAPVLGPADEASAAINNQNLLNVDRGGETTRALARSAANADPEARAIIDKAASDRFAAQGDRARSFIDRLAGGPVDDIATQDAMRSAAKSANDPAYKKAFSAPAASDMSSPSLLGLLKSPAVRDAAKAAEKRGADRAVVEGFDPIKNPFVFDGAGNVSMKPGVKPTLQFWNQVKINLDGEIGVAQRAGDKTLVSDLTALKKKLVSELDTAVPEYAAARQGAAAFFGAEDALDAGKKFVTLNRQNGEVEKALGKMKPAERQAFSIGFASELKDQIAQAGDRTNVINKIFGSAQSRDKIKLALGDKAYGEFEQFVRVENTMDKLRGAMGNSTTARQLVEMGLAGGAVGGAAGLYTGDWKAGVTAAVLTGLAKKGGAKIDERITKRVAELLLEDNPAALKKVATLASNSPKAGEAVRAIEAALSMAVLNISTRPASAQPGGEPAK